MRGLGIGVEEPVQLDPKWDERVLSIALGWFDSIGLAELDAVSLLDRVDTKAVLSRSAVPRLLMALMEDYVVLEHEDTRCSSYSSLYFDQLNLQMFKQHHDGLLPRYKFRTRTYLDSGLTFFEVKRKSNQGRTVKSRVRIPARSDYLGSAESALVREHTGFEAHTFRPSVEVRYRRIMLTDRANTERVSLDLDLSFNGMGAGADVSFEPAAICEVKQARFNRASPALRALRDVGARTGSMSKYCIGVTMCRPDVRHNAIKPALRRLESVSE